MFKYRRRQQQHERGSSLVPAVTDISRLFKCSSKPGTGGEQEQHLCAPEPRRALHGFAQQTRREAESKPTKLAVNSAHFRPFKAARRGERAGGEATGSALSAQTAVVLGLLPALRALFNCRVDSLNNPRQECLCKKKNNNILLEI